MKGLLATLMIKLGLDSKEFKSGINSAEKQTSKFGSAVKKIGGLIAGAFAVGVIKNFLNASIKLYDIQAQAENQLLVALKGRADVQQGLISQAKELQGKTLFGDEETIKAQALIAAFVKEEDSIKRIIPLVQDLATAKMMNLSSAADLVAKTLGSSTNALSRYGIEVEGAVGSSQRLESLANGLNNAFGGQAEAAATTGAGAFKQLGNAIGDLKEEIGGLLTTTAVGQNGSGGFIGFLKNITEGISGFFGKVNKARSYGAGSGWAMALFGSKKDWSVIDDAIKSSGKSVDENTDKTQKHTLTIAELRAKIDELKNSLDNYNISQGSEIQNTLKEIEVNEKLLKSLTTIQSVRSATPSLMTGQKTATGVTPTKKETHGLELGKLNTYIDQNTQKAKDLYDKYFAVWDDFKTEMAYSVADFGTNVVGNLGEAFGEMLKTGDFPEDFGKNILSIIGGFISQLGKMLIGLGIASEAFQALLKSAFTNPVSAGLAIAAGAALVLLGGAISGFAKAGPTGSASNSVSSSPYSSTGRYNPQNQQAKDNKWVFELDGTKLKAVLNNVERKNVIIR